MTSREELLTKALERSVIAIDDWLRTYAADLCDPARVEEASKRIGEYGTLSYIARVQEQNREALYGLHAQGPSKFSPGDPVEVRKQNDKIDEIVIRRGDVHIEQMSGDVWFMGVDGADGSYWQFWFGSKNRKSHVEFRHTETVSAAEQESSLTSADRS